MKTDGAHHAQMGLRLVKAYCINLDRRPDRLAHMAAQFVRLAMTVERIPAVDGHRPDIAMEADRITSGLQGKMAPTAYACFQSHRQAWRLLLASGDAHAMVFEDDLLLADGIETYLLEGWIPADADIVKLETWNKPTHVAAGPGLPAGARRLFRLRSRHHGTGCYVIAAAAARRLLAQTDGPLKDPIDKYMFDHRSPAFHDLTIYQMIPAPAIQGNQLGDLSEGGTWAATSIPGRWDAGSWRRLNGHSFQWLRDISRPVRQRLRGWRRVTVAYG
jgi:glycosyl transferase family 25